MKLYKLLEEVESIIRRNYINRPIVVSPSFQYFLKLGKSAKQFLKDNPEIAIMVTDKSNVTVALDVQYYLTKSKDLLSDNLIYRPLPKDQHT